MTHESSILFDILSTKGAYQRTNLMKFHLSSQNISNFFPISFHKNHIKFQDKRSGGNYD